MAYLKKYLPLTNVKYKNYFDRVDQLRLQSRILNSDANKLDGHYIVFDRESINNEILKLQGNSKGEIHVGKDKWVDAIIPALKKEVALFDERLAERKRSAKLEGKPEPAELDSHFQREMLRTEAELTVRTEELEALQKMLSKFVEKDVEKHNNNVLRNGPKGVGRLRGGVLVELDGMAVSLSDDKIPYISETHPLAKNYVGYATSDYYVHIVFVWGKLREEQAKKHAEATKKALKLDPEYKDNVPMSHRTGSNVAWPVMPDHVKPIVEVKKEETKELTRTKK